MTKADQILEQMHDLKKQMLEDVGKVEIQLADPNQVVLEAIQEHGGIIGRTEWDQWCRSSGCACGSHDAGQASTFVEVPPDWVLTDKRGEDVKEVFDVDEDFDAVHPIMVIPSEIPQLVWERQKDHWAGRTHLADSRLS